MINGLYSSVEKGRNITRRLLKQVSPGTFLELYITGHAVNCLIVTRIDRSLTTVVKLYGSDNCALRIQSLNDSEVA